MAIIAVTSNQPPDANFSSHEIWAGSFGIDGEEGGGLTTAAIMSFFEDLEPGIWYSLLDFTKKVNAINWDEIEEPQWTSLEIKQSSANGDVLVPVNVKITDAVRSLCAATVSHLTSFEKNNIWVRFE